MVLDDCKGPIYLSDDEEAVHLGKPAALKRVLSQEKVPFWKDKPSRWGRRWPCCAEHAHSPTLLTCDDLSTSALISKCVRGVCEL